MTETELSSVDKTPRTPKRVTLGTLVALSLSMSLASGVLGFFLAQRHGSSGVHGAQSANAGERYQCPMHPTIIQDHPGDCPICGMKLVKMAEVPSTPGGSSDVAPSSGERKVLFYRSPMNPQQTSPTPRKDEMGMDYLPVYADEIGDNSPPVAGLSTIDIDPSRQQLIGLTTAEAVIGKVGGAWRTVGRVVVDETRVHHVNIKVSGFVERIYADFIGKQVYRGTPLFSMYSPDLLAAQDEYLLAIKNRGILSGGTGSPPENDTLVKAARRKLTLWDVPDKTLDQIARTGETTKTITFYSPAAGVVTKKDIVQGMRLEAGAMPYEIVDLSSVWVVADVYESELRFVKQGMQATLTLNAFPNREFSGKTVFIDPMLDPMTRTVKVRLTFPNPAKELKPEMFGEVVLKRAPRDGLTIPTDAVIESGTSEVVFVALGSGKFQPRLVQLGESNGDRVEITSGLAKGERVVTRANFLVDSESRLRASLAALTDEPKPASQPESARVLGPVGVSASATPAAASSSADNARPPAPSKSNANQAMPAMHEGHASPEGHATHEGHGVHSR